MLTGRSWAVLATGGLLWVTSRVLGTPDLHMAAIGFLSLPLLSGVLVRFIRHDLSAVRRLSTRRAFPGTRIRVEVEVRNRGSRRSAMLLLEDRVPSSLGPTGRGVLGEVRAGTRAKVAYDLTAASRGRYSIGPLTVLVSDPFDLVRRRVEFDVRHDLIVYPAIEEIGSDRPAAPLGGAGESSTRQLFVASEEFYTMRAYEEGDDLRRIHWPSVARTGELMIRQDEASRRAAASVFLDNRETALGRDRAAFERGVSAAASIGALYLRTGYRLRLGTPDTPTAAVDIDRFLETLALAKPGTSSQLTPALARLVGSGPGGGALVLVTHVPSTEELAALSRIASAASSRVAVLVPPGDPMRMTLRARTELDRGIVAARNTLGRAGWKVIVLSEGDRLEEKWRTRSPLAAASS